MEHLADAPSRPTEMIFHLLRSISSECLMRAIGYSAELMSVLEYIIKWLQQVCVRQLGNAADQPQTKIRIVSRHLVPSGQATCMVASRVNFSNTQQSAFHNHTPDIYVNKPVNANN
jgi:hypothetical protein